MQHTLILITPKVTLNKSNYMEFIFSLFDQDKIEVDYFGIEIDNPLDYIDNELEMIIKHNCFITIYFEGEEINYKTYSKSDIFKLLKKLFTKSNNPIITADEKDIDIIF